MHVGTRISTHGTIAVQPQQRGQGRRRVDGVPQRESGMIGPRAWSQIGCADCPRFRLAVVSAARLGADMYLPCNYCIRRRTRVFGGETEQLKGCSGNLWAGSVRDIWVSWYWQCEISCGVAWGVGPTEATRMAGTDQLQGWPSSSFASSGAQQSNRRAVFSPSSCLYFTPFSPFPLCIPSIAAVAAPSLARGVA